jgi:hypothetical protein
MRHALTFAGFIHMTKDMTIPYDYQKWLVESMRKEGARVQTAMLETEHCPNLTAMEGVVGVLRQVAAGEQLEEKEEMEDIVSTERVQDAIAVIGAEKPWCL